MINRSSTTKHRTWLKKAEALTKRSPASGGSPHPSVKVGVIIVSAQGRRLSTAVNRMAKGVNWQNKNRLVSKKRSLWINCAEQLAIARAAQKGTKLKNATMYLTLEPCAYCAGMIIEAGIRELIIPANTKDKRSHIKKKWLDSIKAGMVKMKEAGVNVRRI